MFSLEQSKKAFAEAKQYIPGGVNSPVRSYKNVGSTPPFIKAAKGSSIFDIDGHKYIDYVMSWGPMILGHSYEDVVKAILEQAQKGTSYGAPTELETQLAKMICQHMPSMEEVRMVNSGTEATMSALRLARGYTKRHKIVKCIGCYHGHSDGLLVRAGSGLATFGVPDSLGVTPNVAQDTLTVPYNDLEAMKELFAREGESIAALIIEPVAGNMGCIPPEEGYLEGLRKLTQEYGTVLIFDEVMSGFRSSPQGAQGLYNIDPDLTCLGKVIGGGLPMSAFGGKREIMEFLAPHGPVYQAGTLSGNPLAMVAGMATLERLMKDPSVFSEIEEKTTYLCETVAKIAQELSIPLRVQQVGSMFTFFFTDKPVRNFDDAQQTDVEAFKQFFHYSLHHGVYYAPSPYESNFMSASHSQEDLDNTIAVARGALEGMEV